MTSAFAYSKFALEIRGFILGIYLCNIVADCATAYAPISLLNLSGAALAMIILIVLFSTTAILFRLK